MSGRRRVSVITLGGTIASVPDSYGNDAVPRLTAEQLVESVPLIHTLADLELHSYRQYPSGDLTFDDIVELARLIEAQAEGVDGVVVTQGTDTLEESSFLLDQLLRTEIPVVMTGAMRNAGLPGADGPANLLAAVRIAACDEARGLGPVVVFADEIHLPRFVRKTHSSSVTAFESSNLGPIGWVTEERVRVLVRPVSRPAMIRLDKVGPCPTVGIITFGLGSSPLKPDHVVGFQGLVLEAFGGGHVPSRTIQSLVEIQELIPVVFASRTGAGELYRSTYSFPGSERDLLDRGFVSAGSLDGLKARVLLSLLLATGADAHEVAEAFGSLP